MHLGRGGLRLSGTHKRRNVSCRPVTEFLEDKTLMSTLQLGAGTTFNLAGQTTTAPNGPQTIGGQLPFIADTLTFNSTTSNQTQGNKTTDPGLGILETGSLQAQGVGYHVAALGDMNSDGSNDFLIGAPSVTTSSTGVSLITPAQGTTDQAFLLFGNRSATVPTTQSWLSSTPEERVGVINNVGGSIQTNPFTNRGQPYNYNFDGITFITSQATNSDLGAFVASAGPNAFVIGAPNYPGGGRLYYIAATSSFNSLSTKVVDLDSPTSFSGLTILTFEPPTGSPNTLGLGTSFAYIPNLFGDGVNDVAIGIPGASVTPSGSTRTSNGAVFIYQVPSLPLTAGSDNVITVSTASASLTLAGANSNDGLGASIANAGSVDNDKVGTQPINDILIGAPSANNNTGAAYLVYGGSSLTASASAKVVDLGMINTNPANLPTGSTPPPVGAEFLGAATGDYAGFSVSSAGDFNGDGISDFTIGSPGAGTLGGRVNLLYGAATNTTTGVRPISSQSNGYASYTLNAIPTNQGFSSVTFTGGNIGDRLGYSLSAVGATATGTSPIVIGAPGANGGQGTVYELQGTAGKTYTTATTLSSSTNNQIARQYTLTFPTNSSASGPIGFGSSVSSFYTGGDADFIAGAPGYTGTLPTTTTTPPLSLVGAASVVLSSLQPSGSQPLLGGTSGGGGGGGGASGGTVFQVPALPGEFTPTTYVSPLGTNFVPSVASLSTFNYAPIPLKVALQEYDTPDGFVQRIYAYEHPGKPLPPTLQNRGQVYSANYSTPRGVWTLGSHVFNRGRFHPGKTYRWTHTSPHNGTVQRVVPAQLSRQKYTSQGNPLGKV